MPGNGIAASYRWILILLSVCGRAVVSACRTEWRYERNVSRSATT